MDFGVIGAGVVGLTTALQLQDEFPNANVTIFADKFHENTTSHVAAGLFRPGTSFTGPTDEITRKWIFDAYDYWDSIRKTPEAPLAGVCQLSGYVFSKIGEAQTRNHFMEKLVPVYRKATENELNICGSDWKYGSFFTTLLIENKLFLPYAAEKFQKQNGKIIEKQLNSFSDIANDEQQQQYDVVLNCSGLGAQKLCSDMKLVPIRGQILKVYAPWIKMAFYGDDPTYIIPGFNGIITLGGSRHYDNYNMEICTYDSMSIRDRCYKMLPSLKKAQVQREAVGLRPHRSPVRVEHDLSYQTQSGDTIKIIHNYGHGGYGVTTAPGTAKYAVKLVKQMLSSSSKYNYLTSKL